MAWTWQHKVLFIPIIENNKKKLAFLSYLFRTYRHILRHFIFEYNKTGKLPNKNDYKLYRGRFEDQYLNARYFEAIFQLAINQITSKIERKKYACALKLLAKKQGKEYILNLPEYIVYSALKDDFNIKRENVIAEAEKEGIKCSLKLKYRRKETIQIQLPSKFNTLPQQTTIKHFDTAIKLPVPSEFYNTYHIKRKNSQFLYLVANKPSKFDQQLHYYHRIGYETNGSFILKYDARSKQYYYGLLLRKKVQLPKRHKKTIDNINFEQLKEAQDSTTIAFDLNHNPIFVANNGKEFHSERAEQYKQKLIELDKIHRKYKIKKSKRRRGINTAYKNELKRLIKQVVKYVKDNNYKRVVLENITGIKIGSTHKGRNKGYRRSANYWYIGLIYNTFLQRLQENDIAVTIINPKHTSQACPVCGYIDQSNRKDTDNFKCVACGYEGRSHVVSAINIYRLGVIQTPTGSQSRPAGELASEARSG